jgi:diadenosine tetraphosphate (Ap4A) HIT family hydrolase
MSNNVKDGVELARRGKHPALICKVNSGWVVLADMQYLRGYCILLADPLVSSINDLDEESRRNFLSDMVLVGDALFKVTGANRINYGIMGNSDPYLHAHIVPRYKDEPDEMLHNHPWAYPAEVMYEGNKFSVEHDGELAHHLADAISGMKGLQK